MHVFQESRTITELDGKAFQQRPISPCPDRCNGASGVPANAGTFSSRYDILNVGVELRFGEMRRKDKGKGKSRKDEGGPAIPPTAADESGFDASEYAAPSEEPEPEENDEFGGF